MAAAIAARPASRRTPLWLKPSVYGLLALFVTWSLLPFYWMIVNALRTDKEIYDFNAPLYPAHLNLEHFQELTRGHFFRYMRNSFEVASITTLISISVGCVAAYAITRLAFSGKKPMAKSLVFSYLVPSVLLFIPMFAIIFRLGLANTLYSLMLVYLTFTVPFCTWMLLGYFKTIPHELEDAALVDGCGRLGTLLRITLPLSAPAIVVVGLFSFTLSWNEFLYALVFINETTAKTVTVGLTSMVAMDIFFWGQMMAGALLVALPPVIIYLLAQRWVVQGLTGGAVKG